MICIFDIVRPHTCQMYIIYGPPPAQKQRLIAFCLLPVNISIDYVLPLTPMHIVAAENVA